MIIADTGPLSHLSKSGHLEVLRLVTKLGLSFGIPREVQKELQRDDFTNSRVLNSDLLCVLALDADADGQANFIRETKFPKESPLARRISRNPNPQAPVKHAGESACIAYAVHGIFPQQPVVWIDDGRGREVARQMGLVCLTTLDVIACLIRLHLLNRNEGERIVDDLLGVQADSLLVPQQPDYILPVDSGSEFSRQWQLYGPLTAPERDCICEDCIYANNLPSDLPAHQTRGLCHLATGWVPQRCGENS
ncbi:hypothetical protein CJEDD_11925 [Corynebacterium jeddahense]|uniref:Uncharacterized protein n=1 Tax=Corynebacterium jeddahense TaxID=1414719 RepID=A0ABY7UMN0_9CORY|nr:hypothetical protein CJEDD_11925 [Corynebacterium jeddahense]